MRWAVTGESGGNTEEGVKRELKARGGERRTIYTEKKGKKGTEGSMAGMLWTGEADGKWTARRDGKVQVEWAAKRIDPTQNPKTVDIEVMAGAYKGVVYLGIYELEGDTLRSCFAMPDRPERPTDFSAAKGTVRAFSEFTRGKESQPPACT